MNKVIELGRNSVPVQFVVVPVHNKAVVGQMVFVHYKPAIGQVIHHKLESFGQVIHYKPAIGQKVSVHDID